nr:MAG TPA: hypothetical protein [Caudoviricetes sp.]
MTARRGRLPGLRLRVSLIICLKKSSRPFMNGWQGWINFATS